MTDNREQMRIAAGIVEPMRLLLANHPPDVQGAALVELVAIFVAGHHPTLRDQTLALMVKTIFDLVPVVEHEVGDVWKKERN